MGQIQQASLGARACLLERFPEVLLCPELHQHQAEVRHLVRQAHLEGHRAFLGAWRIQALPHSQAA